VHLFPLVGPSDPGFVLTAFWAGLLKAAAPKPGGGGAKAAAAAAEGAGDDAEDLVVLMDVSAGPLRAPRPKRPGRRGLFAASVLLLVQL